MHWCGRGQVGEIRRIHVQTGQYLRPFKTVTIVAAVRGMQTAVARCRSRGAAVATHYHLWRLTCRLQTPPGSTAPRGTACTPRHRLGQYQGFASQPRTGIALRRWNLRGSSGPHRRHHCIQGRSSLSSNRIAQQRRRSAGWRRQGSKILSGTSGTGGGW